MSFFFHSNVITAVNDDFSGTNKFNKLTIHKFYNELCILLLRASSFSLINFYKELFLRAASTESSMCFNLLCLTLLPIHTIWCDYVCTAVRVYMYSNVHHSPVICSRANVLCVVLGLYSAAARISMNDR